MGQPRLAAIGLAALGMAADASGGWANEPETAGDGEWISLFNGRDLSRWTAKIRHHEPGDNHARTFRVEDGLLTVSYDGYEDFDDRFGHLFHKDAFSHYRLRLEYRFIGSQAPGGQAWAKRNSGVMLHAQAPETMPAAQDFPISLEAQFLGGLGDGNPRPTGNLCTPGTHVHVNGEFTEQHCVASSSPTLNGDQWVEFEALVLGGDRITHYINGEAVMTYTGSSYGGGVVSGHRPEAKPDGQPLGEGYIALQSESHPVQFRNIRLLDLKGCMNPEDDHYRDYFVAHEPAACATVQFEGKLPSLRSSFAVVPGARATCPRTEPPLRSSFDVVPGERATCPRFQSKPFPERRHSDPNPNLEPRCCGS